MIKKLKEQKEILEINIDQMKELLEDIKNWDKEILEKYLYNIILQNISIKKNLLKEIEEKIAGDQL